MNLILGLGDTGLSIAKYLIKNKEDFIVMDSREEPPGLLLLKELHKNFSFINKFDKKVLTEVSNIFVSPGINLNNPVLEEARKLNKTIKTDIDIFLEQSSSRKVLITGTNGKTTVTSMTRELLSKSLVKKRVLAIGNIGNPVLNHLFEKIDISLIELSSFQLELSSSISSDVAIILNIAEDHLDRHSSFEEYSSIKKKVFQEAKVRIKSNSDIEDSNHISYLDLFRDYEELFLGLQTTFPIHDIINIKASISIFYALLTIDEKNNPKNGVDLKSLIKNSLEILKEFNRLPHRFQELGERLNIRFINDSKSTNIHSTISALESISKKYGKNRTILLCGGDTKGQDLEQLLKIPKDVVKKIIIFGKDKNLIFNVLKDSIISETVKDIEEATKLAIESALPEDIILLSPASSSTDMFADYQERGNEFIRLTGF